MREGDRRLGTFAIADAIRDDSADAIARLRATGARVVMLTGDHEANARRIAAEAGIDDVIAGVRPDGKARAIEELKATLARGESIAMVGDGVNGRARARRRRLGHRDRHRQRRREADGGRRARRRITARRGGRDPAGARHDARDPAKSVLGLFLQRRRDPRCRARLAFAGVGGGGDDAQRT